MSVPNNYIRVDNGYRDNQKHITINEDWATEDYYFLINIDGCLKINKCYLEIPDNAVKKTKTNRLSIDDLFIGNGNYTIDKEESDEDVLVVYYS